MDEKKEINSVVRSVISGIIALFLWGSFFYVPVGEVGVKVNRITGNTSSHSQGIHFKLPLLNGVKKFDVKTQRIDIIAEGASKDLQEVKIEIALNYHLLYEKVNELFVRVGKDYDVKVISPAINESVKAAASQLPVEDIIVKRQELKQAIEKSLNERLSKYFIELESVNLVDIDFSQQFNKVVEEKQIEEQKIKTAEYQRKQAEEYKKKTILEAEAQAEQQRLMKATITENIVQLEWIKKWNGQLPQTILGDRNNVLWGQSK